MATSFFGGAFFGGSFFQAESAVVSSPKGGRVRHKETRYALRVEDEWLSFASLEDLYEYLNEVVDRKEEQAEEKAQKVAGKILRLGKAPKKAQAPRIQVAKAPAEVVDYVAKLNQRIERIYKEAIQAELMALADEDDIEILLASL